MKAPRSIALASLFLGGMIFADAAWADNLGGLVFLLFIWPAGALCCIVLGILTIVTMVKTKNGRGTHTSTFNVVTMIISGAILLIFPIFAAGLERAYTANATISMMLISIMPVEIIAALCLIVNASAFRKHPGPT